MYIYICIYIYINVYIMCNTHKRTHTHTHVEDDDDDDDIVWKYSPKGHPHWNRGDGFAELWEPTLCPKMGGTAKANGRKKECLLFVYRQIKHMKTEVFKVISIPLLPLIVVVHFCAA